MERVECIVLGAGVVGLAVARALALRGMNPSFSMPLWTASRKVARFVS
jgi:L-2-hydroxyglutarate oxidase LhgO